MVLLLVQRPLLAIDVSWAKCHEWCGKAHSFTLDGDAADLWMRWWKFETENVTGTEYSNAAEWQSWLPMCFGMCVLAVCVCAWMWEVKAEPPLIECHRGVYKLFARCYAMEINMNAMRMASLWSIANRFESLRGGCLRRYTPCTTLYRCKTFGLPVPCSSCLMQSSWMGWIEFDRQRQVKRRRLTKVDGLQLCCS